MAEPCGTLAPVWACTEERRLSSAGKTNRNSGNYHRTRLLWLHHIPQHGPSFKILYYIQLQNQDPPLPDTHTLFSIFLKERTNNLLSSTETGKHQESGGFLLWTEKSSDFLNSNKVVSEAREGRGTYIKQSLPQTTGALPPSDLLLGSASSSLFLLSGILTSSSALHPAQPCLWSSCHPV